MKIHRTTAAGTLAALALVSIASCSAPGAPTQAPAPDAAASSAPAGDASAPAGDPAGDAAGAGAGGAAQSAAVGQAASAVAGLAALGGLGQGQGAGEQVRGLGGQMVADAQALAAQLSAEGAAAPLTAEQQATLADLGARTGAPFDQAWLRAATDALTQARDAANAVLASADATPEARAAAEETLARLDALAASLADSSTAAGADTPQAVDAGNGGQAAEDLAPIVALGLLGTGAALIGGAAWRRRQTS